MRNKLLGRYEKFIFYFLMGILYVYIAVEIITLCYFFIGGLLTLSPLPEYLFFDNAEASKILPPFFSILISVELIDTLRHYMRDHSIQSQHIITIGIIAITRKLLILDFTHGDPLINFSLASLIITLALAFYFIKKASFSYKDE
jgi:uncharacterized membrane protein (DUF373 family)